MKGWYYIVSNKVYNMFSKAFWTKENLFNKEDYAKMKSDLAKIKEESKQGNEKVDDLSKKISKIGWKLTLGITIPLILSALFGVFGMVIGGIIFVCVIFSLFK